MSNTRYAQLMYAIHGDLVAAGVSDKASIEPDELLTDADANHVHDQAASEYPWGP